MDFGNAGIDPGGSTLAARAKAIVLTPRDEWPKIAAETDSPGDVFRRHVLPLAAIGPVASLIGGQVFGYGAFGFSYKPGLVAALGSAVVSYAITLLGIWVLSLIADFLAPKFGGESNRAQAFKLVAYGATASFLAGIFGLIPSLGVFALLGLYSLYLFYTGSGPLM
ncbi:MAG TPA: Yip1 family protein, partial [Novosphingobium sp.]|nr:Yip1 family protein [Novosphingobium sp.]